MTPHPNIDNLQMDRQAFPCHIFLDISWGMGGEKALVWDLFCLLPGSKPFKLTVYASQLANQTAFIVLQPKVLRCARTIGFMYERISAQWFDSVFKMLIGFASGWQFQELLTTASESFLLRSNSGDSLDILTRILTKYICLFCFLQTPA